MRSLFAQPVDQGRELGTGRKHRSQGEGQRQLANDLGRRRPHLHGGRRRKRFRAGFGIYDAPEPGGPWTTAYFTEAWDVGPGETSCFPTKWMSADGKTLYLVFSGNDYFSLRKATITCFGQE
jgi:hypothetical protein